MTDFQEGDRVQYVEGYSDLIGRCGTVIRAYEEDGSEFVEVRLDGDDEWGTYNWFPWRLQRIEDDFMPSEYGLEVLL